MFNKVANSKQKKVKAEPVKKVVDEVEVEVLEVKEEIVEIKTKYANLTPKETADLKNAINIKAYD